MEGRTPDTSVDLLFEEHQALVEFLMDAGQISLRNSVDNNFRKTLAVAAASHIESRMSDTVIGLFSEVGNAAEPLVEFVINKAIARQYHTLFEWRSPNANAFFGLFGANFRQFMVDQVNNDSNLASSIKSFLEIGQLRNELVHQNFAAFPLDKTVEEIYGLYGEALAFIQTFPTKVIQYIERPTPGTAD